MPQDLPVKRENKVLYSFCTFPDADFNTREQGEKIILILRAHLITQFPWIFNSIAFLSLIVGFNFYLKITFSQFFSFYEVIAINFLFLAVVFSYVVLNITSWFFNVGIITNRRILVESLLL